MVEEVEKFKDDDLINGFAIVQLCIAKKGCANKQELDNPSWFPNVLSSFIQPYTQKDGKWNSVIDQCRKLTNHWYLPAAKYRCQELMANYHISHDLQNAVNRNGCGTKQDWEAIGKIIKSCVADSDMNILFSTFAQWEVMGTRNNVRSKCIKQRKSLGLQVEF